MPSKILLPAFAVGAAVGSALTAWLGTRQPAPSVPPSSTPTTTTSGSGGGSLSPFLKFGMPGPTTDVFVRDAYALSYNRATRNANWAAEHLSSSTLHPPSGSPDNNNNDDDNSSGGSGSGVPDRSHSRFVEENGVPPIYRARLADYVGSGLDRGHLVPAADVRSSQHAIDQTFILSNISPQVAKNFNRGYWGHFENFVRSLTAVYDDVYVVTGPLYLPALDPSDGKHYVRYQVLGSPPNTAVPTHFFKVIVATKGTKTVAEAFVLPNAAVTDRPPLTDFVVPADTIERASGLTLFPGLDLRATPSLCRDTRCAVVPFRSAASRTLAAASS
ncbi:hypothetical protein BC831DRAFT_551737 [Entophlyctis helioformis]|nr:hypothetical protein BC831DRAFT_551737 [Entophlyctis helioformis]